MRVAGDGRRQGRDEWGGDKRGRSGRSGRECRGRVRRRLRRGCIAVESGLLVRPWLLMGPLRCWCGLCVRAGNRRWARGKVGMGAGRRAVSRLRWGRCDGGRRHDLLRLRLRLQLRHCQQFWFCWHRSCRRHVRHPRAGGKRGGGSRCRRGCIAAGTGMRVRLPRFRCGLCVRAGNRGWGRVKVGEGVGGRAVGGLGRGRGRCDGGRLHGLLRLRLQLRHCQPFCFCWHRSRRRHVRHPRAGGKRGGGSRCRRGCIAAGTGLRVRLLRFRCGLCVRAGHRGWGRVKVGMGVGGRAVGRLGRGRCGDGRLHGLLRPRLQLRHCQPFCFCWHRSRRRHVRHPRAGGKRGGGSRCRRGCIAAGTGLRVRLLRFGCGLCVRAGHRGWGCVKVGMGVGGRAVGRPGRGRCGDERRHDLLRLRLRLRNCQKLWFCWHRSRRRHVRHPQAGGKRGGGNCRRGRIAARTGLRVRPLRFGCGLCVRAGNRCWGRVKVGGAVGGRRHDLLRLRRCQRFWLCWHRAHRRHLRRGQGLHDTLHHGAGLRWLRGHGLDTVDQRRADGQRQRVRCQVPGCRAGRRRGFDLGLGFGDARCFGWRYGACHAVQVRLPCGVLRPALQGRPRRVSVWRRHAGCRVHVRGRDGWCTGQDGWRLLCSGRHVLHLCIVVLDFRTRPGADLRARAGGGRRWGWGWGWCCGRWRWRCSGG